MLLHKRVASSPGVSLGRGPYRSGPVQESAQCGQLGSRIFVASTVQCPRAARRHSAPAAARRGGTRARDTARGRRTAAGDTHATRGTTCTPRALRSAGSVRPNRHTTAVKPGPWQAQAGRRGKCRFANTVSERCGQNGRWMGGRAQNHPEPALQHPH